MNERSKNKTDKLAVDLARRFRELMKDECNHPPGMNCQHPFADLLILADAILVNDDARRAELFKRFNATPNQDQQ